MDSERKDSKSAPRSRKPSACGEAANKGRSRIIIADDDPIILEQIASFLGNSFDVVGRAGNGRELVEAVQRLAPAVAVVDITMPEMNGIDAAREITSTCCDVKVVMLSVLSDYAFVQAAFNAGASGYVVKLHAFTDLIPAIHIVLAGQQYWPRDDSHPSEDPPHPE